MYALQADTFELLQHQLAQLSQPQRSSASRLQVKDQLFTNNNHLFFHYVPRATAEIVEPVDCWWLLKRVVLKQALGVEESLAPELPRNRV